VVRVVVTKELCAFHTSKGERYYFALDAIVGLKLEESEERRKNPNATGFR
jgi:hypothetical protein